MSKFSNKLLLGTALTLFGALSLPAVASQESVASPPAVSSGHSKVQIETALQKNAFVSMKVDKTIAENIENCGDSTTLSAALKAADLMATLGGKDPFTIFAPANVAFDKLSAGTVDNLMKPENKAKLTSLLTYHVVPGKLTVADLEAKVREHGGKATLKTVQGEELGIVKEGEKWWITDGKGTRVGIAVANVMQSNGVLHFVEGVLIPKDASF